CRFRFFVEQRFRRDDESWCADPALQRGVLEERFLERMQDVVLRDPFDRRDGPSLCFRREHEARRHQATVEQDRAGATVTRRAAFFGARQTERVAQRRQQRLMTVAQEFGRLTVDGRVDVQLHRIRPAAIFAARFVRTPATVRRYATVPRLSSIGLAAALAAAAAAFSARSSSFDPMSAVAASGTSNAVGATAPMATRAAVQTPFASSVTLTPAPATAMSISLRGIRRRYASAVRGAGRGIVIATSSSPRSRTVRPGAVQNVSTGTVRSPFGPAITHSARFTIRAHVVSAAGEALHKLPPTVPRPWICVEPIK